MPSDFSITARLHLELGNITRATADLQRQFSALKAPVNVGTGATVGLQKVTSGAQASAAALRQMQSQAAATSATLSATVTVTNQRTASLRSFGEQAGLAARRFVAFTVAAGSLVTATRAIQEGTRAAVEFGLAMNKVEQVSDEVSSKIGALRNEIGSLATGLGVSSSALAETAITLKQAGLSIDQTRSALKALALTDLAPTFDSMKQSTEGLIASFRQFNLSSSQFEQTLSSMNAVAGKFAVESSDIITAVQKAGGAFKLSAGDMKSGSEALNEFMALFTSVRATTRESADAIATGLRTVFTRFQRGDTVKALGDLGINLRYTREEARALGNTNLTDQFVGAYEAVRRLSQGLEGLRETDPRYAQVVEQLGGYRQISRVVPLLKEFKTAEEAKNIAVAGGISLQLAAEKRQESLSNKISKLKEEYLELFRKITESKSFQVLADSMLSVASAFAKVLDYARPLLPLLVGLAAVKVGVNLGGLAGGFGRAFAAPPGAAVSSAKPNAGVLKFATGGHVPGSGNTDTVPAVLTPGEFVMKKSAAERIGYQRLHQLNSRPERFAGGGKVPGNGGADSKAETGEYKPAGPRVFSPLPPTGPRKPLGTRANDALVQALSLLTAPNRRRVGYASGGFVPGAGNNDTEPALLMPGEFVLNKGAVARLGVPSLRDLNEGRSRFRITKYAGGSENVVGGELERLLGLRDRVQAGVHANRRILSEGPGLIGTLSGATIAGAAAAVNQLHEEMAAAAAELGDFERLLGEVNNKIAQLSKPPASPAQQVVTAAPPVVPPKVAPPAVPVGPAPVPSVPVESRGQALLARLKAKQPPVPKPTDDIQVLSFNGVKASEPKVPSEPDRPFVSVAADVYRDSEDKAETAREKRARAFFDKLNGGPEADTSFVSQLKTKQQQEFFARFAVGTGTGPSLAERAAAAAAAKSGDIGRAGIASGAVENAAFEAVARLAVAPPKGFDPNREDAAGFVFKQVKNAVRAQLTREYGSNAKRFGGYIPTDANGNTVEVAGREPDPSERVDTDAVIARAQAREAERAKQLKQVRGVLPGGVIPTDRAGRLATLQALGEGKTQAVTNAAASRFTDVLAGHVGKAIGVTPPGATPPGGNFVGSAPGDRDDSSKRVRDGIHTVPLAQLEEFGKSLGLLSKDIVAVRSQLFAAASQVNKVGNLTAGLSDAALEVRGGKFSRVAGVVNNASVFNPLSAQVNKFVRDGEKALPPPEVAPKPSTLTSAEHEYQARQLVAAQQKFGGTFGVAEDEVRANRQRGRGQARGDIQAFEFEQRRRAQSGAFVDPLLSARDTRRQRLDDQRQAQQAVAQRANAGGRGTVGDRIAQRQARDAAGIDGVTDPLEIKNAAVQAFRDGNAGILGDNGKGVLDAVKDKLSPAQFAQVTRAAQQAGYLPDPGAARPKPTSEDLATFTQSDDGSRTVSGGLLKDRIDRLTAERVRARGGERNLSAGTLDDIRQQAGREEDAQVRRELVSAQKNLLAVLNPEMTAHERNKKALEDVERAMQGLAKVARDSSGKLLGLSATVDDATRAGVSAPGAGGAGYRFSSAVGGRLAAARDFLADNKLTRFNERLAGVTQTPLFGLGATGLGIGATLLADKLDRNAGSADDAVRTAAGTSSYRTNKAASGTLQGAALGAAVGAVGGPVGIAVGAVVGGLGGLVSSLSDAAKDIRQAKINNALTELGDKLSAFATGVPDAATLSAVRTNLTEYRKGADMRAADEATNSGFYQFVTGAWYDDPVDTQKYVENLRAGNRKELGPQLPQIKLGLTKQAELLGRENAGARPDDLLKRLREAGGGVNAELLRLTAEFDKVPVRQVEDEVKKALVSAQQQRRVQDQNKAARASADQQANTFGRLLQAVQAASDSLYGLQQRAGALADVLDGNISASRVSAHAERLDEGLGRLDGSALKPLDIVAGATGGYGVKLRESGGAADAVERALPGVLASVAAGGGLKEDNTSSLVVEGLYRSLGYSDRSRAPESVQRAVLAVQGGVNDTVNGKGEGAFREEVGTDATRYAQKLLESVTGPLKDVGGKIAKQYEDNANRLVDGLASIHQRLQQVGQLYDQLGSLRTQNFRQTLQFRAEAAGRGNQALDFASVQELEFGANQRQQRLAGVSGPRAFDPRFLGSELAQVRGQIGAATERQQEVFERTGGKGPEFGAAAEEVLRLKYRAANLQQALKSLADVSERNAVIQEKLNRLKQEEDGRLGLAERVATASPEERLRLNQGAILANAANNRGSLDGFSADQNRLIFDYLNTVRGVTLTGFKGSPRAEDVRERILKGGQFGAQFQLTDAQKQEKAALQGAATARNKTGEDAVAQLIAHQEAGSAELFRNLQQQQTQFFSKMERLLLGLRRADLENGRARAAADQGALVAKTGSRDALAGVGVTTTAQLEALRGKRGDVEELRAAIAAQKAEQDRIAGAKGLVGGLTPNTDPAGSLGAVLARSGLSGEQLKRVSERTEELSGSDEFVRLRGNARRSAADGSAEQKRALDAVEQKILRQALATEAAFDSDASKKVGESRAKLTGLAGVDPLKVEQTLRGPNADAFLKGFDAFDASGNKIEDFGSKLTAAAAEVAKFDAALKRLSEPEAGPAGPVAARAYGGDIFRPVGTDTVPAMLTPGEFVVNARSAAANAGLLNRINEARGAVYLADGGQADYDLFAASPYGRVAQNEAQRVASDRVKKQQDRLRERDDKNGGLINSEARRQLYSRFGPQSVGRDLYERFARQQATDTAAGAQAAAAQALNFNIRAGAFAGVRRPGDEGQLSIAARVAGVAERSLDERFRQDDALRRYTAARVTRQEVNLQRFASGGAVGGAGTGDTVPSLLTPGEFVLNSRAVARLGVHNVQRFNQGGPVGHVSYLASGGVAQAGGGSSGGAVSFSGEAVKAMTDLSSTLAQFVQQAGGFGQVAQQLAQSFTVFVGGAQQLSQALNSMPRSFTGQFEHRVTVTHNGAEVFAKMTPYIEQAVADKVNATLSRVFKEHLPDAGVQL